MKQASVFISNRSQAVRLPKAVALPDNVKQVDVVVIGRTRILTPVGEAWDVWFSGPNLSDDFVREQPEVQEREGF